MASDRNEHNQRKEQGARPASSRRRHPVLRGFGIALAVLLALPLLAALLLLAALHSESGTRLLWEAAQRALPGQLSGTVAGTLTDGLRLRDVVYADAGRRIAVDRLEGRWHLSLSPLKLTIESLHAGTVDVRLPPSASKEPAQLPQDLTLPLALDIRDVAVQRVVLHNAASDTTLGEIKLHGTSDRVHHRLVLEQVDTPYGRAAATVALEGRQPFPLSGTAGFTGKVGNDTYRLDAKLSGTLPDLGIEAKASGDRLSATAMVRATPFASVPFEFAQIAASHVDPKAFSPGAPTADLSLRAELKPLKTVSSVEDPTLVVSGPVRLDNAKPGRLDEGRLPLESATLNVVLDPARQQLSDMRVDLVGNGTIRGHGEARGTDTGKLEGEFAFDVAGLDLHALYGSLRPTQLHGPVTVRLVPGAAPASGKSGAGQAPAGQPAAKPAPGTAANAKAAEHPALDTQRITVDLADKTYAIKLNAAIDAAQFRLDNARLSAGSAALAANGRLARSGDMAFALQGALDHFNPALWIGPDARYGLSEGAAKNRKNTTSAKKAAKAKKPAAPIDADINMGFDLSGRLAPERQVKLAFNVHDSRYGKLPMTGDGTLEAAGTRLLPSKARLVVAGNTVDLQGSFGNPGDTLAVQVDAPQIERLGYGLAGALQLDGKVTGTPSRPNVKADWRGARLAFGDQRVTSASGKIDIEGTALDDPDALARARLDATVDARGVRLPDLTLNRLGMDLSGSFGDHKLSLDASGKVHRQPLVLSLAAQGGLKKQGDAYAWDGTVRKLENRGVPRVALTAPVELSVAPERVRVGAARMEVAGAQLDLKRLDYDRGRVASEGALEAIDVKRMLELAQRFTGAKPPVRTDLVLDSRWNFSLAESGSGFAQVERRSGDMVFGTPRGDIRLGLTGLAARADLDGQTLKADAHAAARDFGTVTAQGHTMLQQRDGVLTIGPDAPLTATASAALPRLEPIGALIGPQVALRGNLGMDLAASGTVGDPKLTGTINGDALSVTLFDLGIQLRDGVMRIAMTPETIDLKQVEFHGGDGTLRANGRIGLQGGNPDIAATIVAQHLQLFASPDRQLVLSGQAKANNVDQQLRIDGDFTVDRALIDLPPANAPQLGDDVVVVGKEGKRLAVAEDTQNGVAKDAAQPTGPFAPVANIGVDLGNDFRFHGAGAELKLAGKMTVHSEPNEPLTANGTVRVVDGTYSVFGQTLAIERGLVNFTGPIDNPNINILAMRRKQEVEAGVEVTGYAKDPRIQLVSEPSVSDEEKLSWLMFGHGTASSGTGQLNASSAALSYLANQGGSKIAKGIGLDEFSFGASESGLSSQQVVTLGKAISERFTVGYEQSLTGAASIAKLTYQLSQRWSVVARAGAINGIEALFDKRFD